MDQKRIAIYLFIGVLFYLALLALWLRADKIEMGNQLSGIVQEIIYGDKGTPKVL